ncbi:hypothetical protein PN499_11640 [Kamptonema animale CS-326]|jgi:hypothetical protein|uniref:hypothetical protein n=1 Tax=Kamptonema TaxID=1501433 RepID=UPI0002D577B9|nr:MULTISPECIES: hypothetical protein [Kamptonema]MDB9511839.1 hypothetical protein [Kamptonema animale CS-326]
MVEAKRKSNLEYGLSALLMISVIFNSQHHKHQLNQCHPQNPCSAMVLTINKVLRQLDGCY